MTEITSSVILQLEVERVSQALHDSGVDALQPGAVSVQLGVRQEEAFFSKSKKYTLSKNYLECAVVSSGHRQTLEIVLSLKISRRERLMWEKTRGCQEARGKR